MHAIKLVILLSLYCCSSFAQSDFGKYKDRWSSVFKIEEKHKSGKVFYTLYLYDQNFKVIKECVQYKKQNIYIEEMNKRDVCGESLKSPEKIIHDVFNFEVKLNEKDKVLIINKDSKSERIKLLALNSDSFKVSFAPPSLNSHLLGSGEICFDVGNDCSVKIDKNCSLCEYGVYEVIASSCKNALRLYCGKASCGTKGAPACIRGYRSTNYSGAYCINDSPIAFCRGKSRVVCIEGELRCN